MLFLFWTKQATVVLYELYELYEWGKVPELNNGTLRIYELYVFSSVLEFTELDLSSWQKILYVICYVLSLYYCELWRLVQW